MGKLVINISFYQLIKKLLNCFEVNISLDKENFSYHQNKILEKELEKKFNNFCLSIQISVYISLV